MTARTPGSAGGPRRVAFLHDNDVYGGMETLQVEIARRIDRDRYLPSVMIALRNRCEASDRFESQLASVGAPCWITTGSSKETTTSLASMLRREQIDVVHIQTRTPTASTKLTFAAALARVPVIVRTEHVSPGPHVDRWTRLRTRPFDWMTDAVMTDSEGDRRQQLEMVGRRADKVIVSYCGIDTEEFDPDHDVGEAKRALGLDPDVTVIGTVGRLHPQKGHAHLIGAAADVLAHSPQPVVFVIVGDGPLEAELRAQAEALGISDAVVFAGFQPDPLPYMQAFDIATMPSLWEGFSISMQQFMALGKPLVASDHHSFREAMVDREHGLIVPVADDHALAKAYLELLEDQAFRARLGRAASDRVRENFSIQRHVEDLMGVYDGILDRPRRRLVGTR